MSQSPVDSVLSLRVRFGFTGVWKDVACSTPLMSLRMGFLALRRVEVWLNFEWKRMVCRLASRHVLEGGDARDCLCIDHRNDIVGIERTGCSRQRRLGVYVVWRSVCNKGKPVRMWFLWPRDTASWTMRAMEQETVVHAQGKLCCFWRRRNLQSLYTVHHALRGLQF